MDMLNSNSSGVIGKKDFKKALDAFNQQNETELDVDSIVLEVFKEQEIVDRSDIRRELNQNQDIQDLAATEPMQD